ncbi:MAG: dTMP kinase [Candidatus Nomurabacteria bacterium]|jgi:dTMP kinase|nr:dTMP kinase [Candidatus Nomurabacteria bacterium]
MHIVIEGQDATGKDTQAKLLADYLRQQGKTVVHYAESGTASPDPFVAKIAQLNYGSAQDIDHRTRVLLYIVNRYEQWRKLAEPALKNNGIVITTRSWYSTLIYEGYAGGVDVELITKLHKLVMPELYFHPDKVVIMTLSDQDRKKRLEAQGKRKAEVFKSMSPNFHNLLNESYLKVAKDFAVPTLDAAGSPEEVHAKLLKLFCL